MAAHRHLRRLALALAVTTIASLFVVPAALAQPTGGGPVVRVEAPTSGQTHRGAITFTGLAVNGDTNQPAQRVAVYGGEVREANYLADVSMDTVRPLAAAFPGRVGNAQIGWTLIFDSNRLSDGRHTLYFVAHFPGGVTATTTTEIVVHNLPVVSPTYRGSSVYGGVVYPSGAYYNGAPYYATPYNTGYYWVNGVRYYNGTPYYGANYYVGTPYSYNVAPTYSGIYYYNGVYYYNGTPYYNGSSYYSGAPAYAAAYPGGYWYNGIYYPTGAVTTGLGWYYQNGIWFYRPAVTINR